VILIFSTAKSCGATTKRQGVVARNSPRVSASQYVAPILRYMPSKGEARGGQNLNFRRRWRRRERGSGCCRLKFVTWTSMMSVKKCGARSVRGRDLTGARFSSSISTTASRRSVSRTGSTSICGTKRRIRTPRMTAHRQAARRLRQVRTRKRTRRPSSRYKMPGGLGRRPDQPKRNRARQRRGPQRSLLSRHQSARTSAAIAGKPVIIGRAARPRRGRQERRLRRLQRSRRHRLSFLMALEVRYATIGCLRARALPG